MRTHVLAEDRRLSRRRIHGHGMHAAPPESTLMRIPRLKRLFSPCFAASYKSRRGQPNTSNRHGRSAPPNDTHTAHNARLARHPPGLSVAGWPLVGGDGPSDPGDALSTSPKSESPSRSKHATSQTRHDPMTHSHAVRRGVRLMGHVNITKDHGPCAGSRERCRSHLTACAKAGRREHVGAGESKLAVCSTCDCLYQPQASRTRARSRFDLGYMYCRARIRARACARGRDLRADVPQTIEGRVRAH
jgi:hypothetical protein